MPAAIATGGGIRVQVVRSTRYKRNPSAAFHSPSTNKLHMEYLIVFSVVGMMASFVGILARCLRGA